MTAEWIGMKLDFKSALVTGGARRIGRELGVRYVLEGSVRKVGDRVRFNAQLIDATTGYHLWSQRYDRELVDIFALQTEITEMTLASQKLGLGASTSGS